MPRPVMLPPVDATPEEIVEMLFGYNPDKKPVQKQKNDENDDQDDDQPLAG